MTRIVDIIRTLAEEHKVRFPVHESTGRSLRKLNLYSVLARCPNVELMSLLDHVSFIHHIRACEALITDGGGPQEESFYLGSPCLLLREATERPEHNNVTLCGFEKRRVLHALSELPEVGPEAMLFDRAIAPSSRATEEIMGLSEG